MLALTIRTWTRGFIAGQAGASNTVHIEDGEPIDERSYDQARGVFDQIIGKRLHKVLGRRASAGPKR